MEDIIKEEMIPARQTWSWLKFIHELFKRDAGWTSSFPNAFIVKIMIMGTKDVKSKTEKSANSYLATVYNPQCLPSVHV